MKSFNEFFGIKKNPQLDKIYKIAKIAELVNKRFYDLIGSNELPPKELAEVIKIGKELKNILSRVDQMV